MLCAIVFVLPGIVIGYERDIEQGSGEVQHYMCSEHFAKLLSVSTVWLQFGCKLLDSSKLSGGN